MACVPLSKMGGFSLIPYCFVVRVPHRCMRGNVNASRAWHIVAGEGLNLDAIRKVVGA